ncbi:MAG: hypothetical protein JKY20_12095 [Alphaproteobacteria bacterium]|nr:hypothetical protein [Alphaproteobacteria bacterium]
MKSIFTVIAVATVAFAVAGCATQEVKPMKQKESVKTMNAKELAKEFAKGSKMCSWKAGKKGKDRGTDYYYKDISATSGNADRQIGKSTLQGKWSINGDVLSLNFGIAAPQNYKLAKIKKKTYVAYLNGVKKKMTFTCK